LDDFEALATAARTRLRCRFLASRMSPVLLAFDTATEHLSVALATAPGEVFAHEAGGGAQASATLLPAILAVLAEARLTLADLDAIAFGCGPGAFTGLRTACSVAQGLAFGAGKPVLPIDTLLAVAEDARGGDASPRRVWVAMDARMNEVYAAQYAFAEGAWKTLDAPMLTTPEQLAERWRSCAPEAVAGNAIAVFGERLAAGAARLAPEALPRARAMLPLARAAWAAGGALDAALALPLYLRDKVAQTTAERDATRAAKLAAERVW
jgi:tRNA threonylcarbamoyladenosine biosynthesis protein TsaB